MSSTFKCWVCKETFEKGQTEEEALKEMEENFPGVTITDCDLVCDDCYKKMGLE